MKIRPVGAELFHADGRTDMTKLTVAFRNSAKAPKNVACSRNHCCHGNVTKLSLCIVVDLEVAVSSIKPLSVAKETQECTAFPLLSSHKTFRATVNNINVLRYSSKVPRYCSPILNKFWGFRTSRRYQIPLKSVQCESCWYMRTDGHNKANRRLSLCMRTSLKTKYWPYTVDRLLHFEEKSCLLLNITLRRKLSGS